MRKIKAPLGGAEAWHEALACYDIGEPEQLALLVAGYAEESTEYLHEPMPADVAHALAAIVLGTRKPNLHGRHRRQLSRADQRSIMRHVDWLRAVRDEMDGDALAIEATAEHRRCEPADVRQWINEQYRAALADLAKQHGVSVKTIKRAGRSIE